MVLVRRLNFSTIYIFADRNSCTYRLLYLYSTYRSLNGSKWIRRNVIQSRRLPDFAFHFTFHCMNCKHNSCRSPDRNFYLVSLRICNRREARRRSSQRSAVMKYIPKVYICVLLTAAWSFFHLNRPFRCGNGPSLHSYVTVIVLSLYCLR